jgi:hypothetical protein
MELLTLNPQYLDQSFGLARILFARHGGYLLLLILPFLLFRRPAGASVLLLAMAACLVATALFTPFVFGPARLDTARTSTQMALFVMVAVAAAAHYRRELRRADAYLLPLSAVLVFLVHEYNAASPSMACCSPRDFDGTRQAFERIGREHGIARATVANPDLGVLSWHKQFNVVDLGLLGSSVTPRLQSGPAFNAYFLEHAAPDIVETHGWWTCRYASMLLDPRFRAMYVEANAPGKQTLPCKEAGAVPTGIWLRRDVMRGSTSRERTLLDDLGREPSVERVAQELRSCQQVPQARPGACTYVARSAYRVLPEFRARGALDRLVAVFGGSRSRDFDLFLLTGSRDGRAYRPAIPYLEPSAR